MRQDSRFLPQPSGGSPVSQSFAFSGEDYTSAGGSRASLLLQEIQQELADVPESVDVELNSLRMSPMMVSSCRYFLLLRIGPSPKR